MEDVSISLKGYPGAILEFNIFNIIFFGIWLFQAGETFCLWQGFLFNPHFKTLLTLCWDKVSLSAFAFLFSELVQYNQTRVDNIAELERRLEDAGYAVGA
ncbi:hypothetical protein ERO13_D02G098900v2 [Gossypium hirsutum]|uniref:Uncharacterized protein isoform X3 n=2 Tax=Gossypium hirsutum TaxID=3635 RepID=A0A1U8JV81_GOSHI|nr:uncharacterized protein LOC107910697 isoform X3 [Gossypium hirsutum]KAG4158061.1 hypothetical protein ERO13_D02G098900v2 [Gossypium hirsutum]KAG4158062.1 hypothetical protein ERO13_D02G098900v2 [Gossypium hirsutum]